MLIISLQTASLLTNLNSALEKVVQDVSYQKSNFVIVKRTDILDLTFIIFSSNCAFFFSQLLPIHH